MRTRRLVLVLLPLIAMFTLATACGSGSSSKQAQSSQLTATSSRDLALIMTPTPYMGWQSAFNRGMAHDSEEAVGFAMEEYFACPPYCAQYGGIDSVEYVETTVGQLRTLFGRPAVDRLNAFDDWPAWAIVAHGTFTGWCMGCMPHEYHVGSNFWVFVLKDRNGMATYATDEDHDIKRLGRPHDVPLPLPDWPTPVNLTPIEG